MPLTFLISNFHHNRQTTTDSQTTTEFFLSSTHIEAYLRDGQIGQSSSPRSNRCELTVLYGLKATRVVLKEGRENQARLSNTQNKGPEGASCLSVISKPIQWRIFKDMFLYLYSSVQCSDVYLEIGHDSSRGFT